MLRMGRRKQKMTFVNTDVVLLQFFRKNYWSLKAQVCITEPMSPQITPMAFCKVAYCFKLVLKASGITPPLDFDVYY